MKKQLLIATLVVLSGSTAFASEDDLFGSSKSTSSEGGKIYGGASLGKTSIDAGCIDDSCVSFNTTNWKVFGGYKITPNIAVEGGYYKIINVEEDDVSLSVTGLGLMGVASLPVSDDVEIFGKAGVMNMKAKARIEEESDSASDSNLLIGAGGTFKVDDNWGIRGEYEHIGGDLPINMYSVGAVFSTL